MTGEEAIRVLKDRTSLEVTPGAIANAIASQRGDVEAAVKQVIDWWASGDTRTDKAAVLLLAALRSQGRSKGQETLTQRNARFMDEAGAFHQAHMPSLPAPFVYGAYSAEKALTGEPSPAAVRARVEKRLARIDEFERQEKAA